uniref:Uncharacterized protein n=1 Tax=Arundo donax TaxID=35708 RepID=A0A0A9G8N1_ARUDO
MKPPPPSIGTRGGG